MSVAVTARVGIGIGIAIGIENEEGNTVRSRCRLRCRYRAGPHRRHAGPTRCGARDDNRPVHRVRLSTFVRDLSPRWGLAITRGEPGLTPGSIIWRASGAGDGSRWRSIGLGSSRAVRHGWRLKAGCPHPAMEAPPREGTRPSNREFQVFRLRIQAVKAGCPHPARPLSCHAKCPVPEIPSRGSAEDVRRRKRPGARQQYRPAHLHPDVAYATRDCSFAVPLSPLQPG
jgi:hypothetical protein